MIHFCTLARPRHWSRRWRGSGGWSRGRRRSGPVLGRRFSLRGRRGHCPLAAASRAHPLAHAGAAAHPRGASDEGGCATQDEGGFASIVHVAAASVAAGTSRRVTTGQLSFTGVWRPAPGCGQPLVACVCVTAYTDERRRAARPPPGPYLHTGHHRAMATCDHALSGIEKNHDTNKCDSLVERWPRSLPLVTSGPRSLPSRYRG